MCVLLAWGSWRSFSGAPHSSHTHTHITRIHAGQGEGAAGRARHHLPATRRRPGQGGCDTGVLHYQCVRLLKVARCRVRQGHCLLYSRPQRQMNGATKQGRLSLKWCTSARKPSCPFDGQLDALQRQVSSFLFVYRCLLSPSSWTWVLTP